MWMVGGFQKRYIYDYSNKWSVSANSSYGYKTGDGWVRGVDPSLTLLENGAGFIVSGHRRSAGGTDAWPSYSIRGKDH